MSSANSQTWLDGNQRALSDALVRLRQAIEKVSAAPSAGSTQTEGNETARANSLAAVDAGLDRCESLNALGSIFGLGAFEKRILLMTLGVELEPSFAAAIARASGAGEGELSMALALALSPDASWSALCPQAPLRRWGLVDLRGSGPLTRRHLKIDERVLHHLLGVNYIDNRLDGVLGAVSKTHPLTARQEALLETLVEAWTNEPRAPLPVLQLCGALASSARALSAELGARLGFRSFVLSVADIPASANERQALARLCDRELALSNGILLVEQLEPAPGADHAEAGAALIDALAGPSIASTPNPLPIRHRPRLRFDVPAPSRQERVELWHGTMGSHSESLGPILDTLANQFGLDADGIHAAWAMARPVATREPSRAMEVLWDSCRTQARRALDALAERIETPAGWGDLVMPAEQRTQLEDVVAHIQRAHQVYERWGWAEKSGRGLGVAALFSGPSGTGKTLAAEVLANALKLDLYRIDLAQVVSKYIGETEKNLSRIFDAAGASGAILLFDEADALFGKRSEVKDSHDRYANIEVSYLLQRMEAYRGLAILTTNQKSALDKAFLRRLRFVIDFPFPDLARRAEIWRRVFPGETPLAELDLNRLARLTISGGNIRSIAINAAFLAASDEGPVSMSHILTAARREYTKLEKPITTAEFGGAA